MHEITLEEWKKFVESTARKSQAKRFINIWDINTGRPGSQPDGLTFYYKKGDYFVIAAHKKESKKEFSVYLPCGNHYPQKEEIKINELKEETYSYIYIGDNVWVKEPICESPFAMLMVE